MKTRVAEHVSADLIARPRVFSGFRPGRRWSVPARHLPGIVVESSQPS